MKTKLNLLVFFGWLLVMAPRLPAQGYIVPNGVTYGGFTAVGYEVGVLQNPTNGNYTGFGLLPNSNYYYTLRDALDAAAIDPDSNQVYTYLNEDITIYGCPDLYFYD